MRRLTIAMNDDLYTILLGYAADQSKRNAKRLSMGEAVRTLISAQLGQLGYEEGKAAQRFADAGESG